ncbi:IgGFc-binding protein [Enhygromyxa salina]|uniref:IgGFc-binding protein N-terminal domain-containing protein n=1 Tax=Enhygromyxa salina TaxID=215803 RepID=A0A2S9YU05_9BACT|nr:IgGFc-binding protein [Enhygromyxa salina]PRQ08519.1 hypothetical protein ENSA7_18050 [Enhygromyxa salina]
MRYSFSHFTVSTFLLAGLAACGDDAVGTDTNVPETSGISTGDGDGDPTGDGDPGDGDGDPGDGDGDPGDGDGDGDGDPTGDGDGDGDPTGDGDGDPTGDGDGDPTGDGDGDPPVNIPGTCAEAEITPTTVGCLFYGVDLDTHAAGNGDQYAIAVSNVQEMDVASVTVERKVNGNWQVVAGPQNVAPLDLHVFPLPDLSLKSSGVLVGGAYRVTSDEPIIAYQFNPLLQSSFTSDASLLYPAHAWDHFNETIHWGDGFGNGYVTIVALNDGTNVQVIPTTNTAGGGGVPAGTNGVPFMINGLNEGDVAEVKAAVEDVDMTGTRILSDEDHPVAVFSGHECVQIPNNIVACDHLEDQIAGLQLWGQNFVASRVPNRQNDPVETSLWMIYASEDNTTINIEAADAVTGLPNTPAVLDKGAKLQFFAGGDIDDPGDFFISADKPIAVVNFMTGWGNLVGLNSGDPAMVQLSPVEQFLPRYVVLVPDLWDNDFLVLTRETDAEVTVDGVAVNDDLWVPVGLDYEVARVPASDGVHYLDGAQPFSVVVVGYDFADSYAYLGGTGTGVINPNPQ